jgi:hypothetical protein
MINRFRHIVFLQAALVTGCFVMSACENDRNQVEALGKKDVGVEEGRNITGYMSLNSKLKARLKAPLMLRYYTDTIRTVFPNRLLVDFYTDSTTIDGVLTAKYGRYVENENRVYLRDSVVFRSIKKDTFYFEDLWWDQNRQLFYTDKRGWQHSPGRIIPFIGFQSDQEFKHYTFFNVSDATLPVPDSTMPKD